MEPPASSPVPHGRDTEALSPLLSTPSTGVTSVGPPPSEGQAWAAPALAPAVVSPNAVGWHLVGALVYALASVLLLAVGPVALSALGPSWLGWLVWPFALFTGWRMVRHFQGLAETRVELAAGAALVIGAVLGMGWAMAAETGWLPPLTTPGLSLSAAPSAPPAATPTGAQFHVGVTVRVTQTQGAGLRVRSGPGVDTAPVGFLTEGAVARIVAGPQYADSFRWWQVEGEGVTGWVADPWLEVE